MRAKALQPAIAVSAARAIATTATSESIRPESDGSRLPLFTIGCHINRVEGACQEGSDGGSRVGVGKYGFEGSHRDRRIRVVGAERFHYRVERVTNSVHERAVILVAPPFEASGVQQRPDVASEPGKRLLYRERRQEQATHPSRHPQVGVRHRNAAAGGAPHLRLPAARARDRRRGPVRRGLAAGTARVASSARQTGFAAARQAAGALTTR